MKLNLICSTILFAITVNLFAQSNPTAIDSNISISRIMTVKNGVIRMAKDPISKNIFYVLTTGKIYEVIRPNIGAAYDSLVDSAATHGVIYVQGMAFFDSTLYISGNNKKDSSSTVGIIKRGKLQPNGSRLWDTLMITDYYQTADYFDHLFTGLVLNPAGDTIYICSGARGDHGEIQTRYGKYPGLRNVPLTTNIYALPTHNPGKIVLPNDSTALASSGYVFCRGVRNHFDMAFDSNGNLFGVENSGDRDHNEEMNWLQRNHHYGFPWKMGDTDNPQQFPSFVPANDKLINHYCRAWRQGFWNNDPTYPQPPVGITLDKPIQNFGPDCDKYRDTSGAVLDASDSSISIGTFTAHRSPLGLVFDRLHVLDAPYNGDAFMLSWTKGYDSCGCTIVPDTGVGPFVDPSQDLVHLHLTFDSLANNFRLNATRIIAEFQHPVDAEIDSNKIYVVENGYAGNSGLYEITMPLPDPPLACNSVSTVDFQDICEPYTNAVTITPIGTLPNDFYWYDSAGNMLLADLGISTPDVITYVPPGNYYVVIHDAGFCGIDTVSFTIPDSVNIQIDSVSHTSCIGCEDGKLFFTLKGGSQPYVFQFSFGTLNGNSFVDLIPGSYTVCVSDSLGCFSCDTATIFDDPTQIKSIEINNDYSLYPNPVSGKTNLSFKGEGKISIRLLSMNGQLIKPILNENLNAGIYEIPIDCHDLSNGFYTVEIFINNFKTFKKLIIIH